MGFSAGMMSEFRELLRPYYLVNLILCSCFPVCRLASPICDYLFAGNAESPEPCELDMRENEILFFLLIVVMIRSRKTNSMNMVGYISSSFVYTKVASLVLFFRLDPRYGLVYLLLFTLQAMLLPEPTYKGPEKITYFRANGLADELKADPKVTWLVTFYAAWSPSSVNFAPVFSKLSSSYGLPNLKFGKIDVGRYPEIAEEHHINTSALTRQLPSVIMFQDGKEVGRAPAIHNGKIQKFLFKEDEMVKVFDLNNLYTECKKDKRYAAQIKKMEEEEAAAAAATTETKKDK